MGAALVDIYASCAELCCLDTLLVSSGEAHAVQSDMSDVTSADRLTHLVPSNNVPANARLTP